MLLFLIKGIIKSAHLGIIYNLFETTLSSNFEAVRTEAKKIIKVKNKAISVNWNTYSKLIQSIFYV